MFLKSLYSVILLACSFIGLGLSEIPTRNHKESSQNVPDFTVEKAVKVFDDAIALTLKHLVDPKFDPTSWQKKVEASRVGLKAGFSGSPNKEEFLGFVINSLLKKTESIEPQFFSQDDYEFWLLRSIYSSSLEASDQYAVQHAGTWFERKGKRWFLRGIWNDKVSLESGLLPGDEILTLNEESFSPRNLLQKKLKHGVNLSFKRTPFEKPRTVSVFLREENLERAFLKAVKDTARVYERGRKKIGYCRLWLISRDDFLTALNEQLKQFKGKSVDGLILDLRDGFGSADYAKFLVPFLGKESNKGQKEELPLFSQPMIVLINKGTQSGKEWMAYHLQNSQRAYLVGTKTAGSGATAELFLIPPQFMLYFPGADKSREELLKSIPFEGKGITPDVVVDQPLVYAAGTDLQLDKALELLSL